MTPAAELAAMLAQRRAHWLQHYFPAGRHRGGVFYLGSADGEAGDSLPVPLRATKAGLIDFAGGFKGDDLSLLARAIGGDAKAGYAEALAYLGISGETTAPKLKPKPPEPKPERDNSEQAQELWREAASIGWAECPGDRYLRNRGIMPPCEAGISRWPDTLRFHEACPFGRERAPAIIVAVHSHRSHMVVAIWRIRLTPAGEKIERKGLGPTKGNASRLFWPDGDEVAITEGVEDALAFHQQHGVPAWAALSATNMAALIVPPRLRRIVVCADNDAAGHAAAQKLARRLRDEGRQVRIIASDFGKDANDALLRRAAS